MSQTTLDRFHKLFPHTRLLQTYGLSELGILPSKSSSADLLWVKVGGAGFETRVVGGMLEVKADFAMLGYLNAPSRFTKDGWFQTGDEVEVNGDLIRFLGRRSEMINVGGEKVYPAEVESVISELDNVADVTVYSEKNSILGEVVCAIVYLKSAEDSQRLASRLRHYCRQRLAPFKVPVKVSVSLQPLHSDRFKKRRKR